MRITGIVLALGAMAWLLYQAAGGENADTVIPQAHQESMEKAQDLEASLQAAVQQRMQDAEADSDPDTN